MIDKLDTPGGHIVCCFVLLVLFVGLEIAGFNWAHDPAMMALGTIYLAMNIKRPGA